MPQLCWSYWTPRHDWVSTGTLQLRITNLDATGVRRSWSDGKRQRIEECLNSFIAGLVLATEADRLERERREERHGQWEEERRQEAERARLRALEARRVKELEAQVERWQQPQRMREYVAVVVQAGHVVWFKDDAWTVNQWAEWATRHADRIDPLKDNERPDEPAQVLFGLPLW